MTTKGNIIIVSVLTFTASLVIAEPLFFGYCHGIATRGSGAKYCYSSITDGIPDAIILSMGLISIFLFLLSLLTYRMRDEVFHAWWSFARWMVPIIVLATIAIQFVPKNGGFFNMDGLIYLLVSAPLYAVFILGSLWKIFSTHRKLNMGISPNK